MPGMTYIQSNVSYFNVGGIVNNLACPYLSNNAQGNIGVAFQNYNNGNVSSTISDTNGNIWYQLPIPLYNFGGIAIWICPSLKSGANIVTCTFLGTGTNRGEFIVMEYQPPPCPFGQVGIQAFWWTPFVNYYDPQLNITSYYSVSQGPFWHTLIACVKCGPNSSSGVTRTWAATPSAFSIDYGLRIQYIEPGTDNSGAVADTTVAYPTKQNSLLFAGAPGTPPINSGETILAGVLLTTIS
jgi:hypothetical protein